MVIDASHNDEARDVIISLDRRWNLLHVVFIEREDDMIRIILSVRPHKKSVNTMKVVKTGHQTQIALGQLPGQPP